MSPFEGWYMGLSAVFFFVFLVCAARLYIGPATLTLGRKADEEQRAEVRRVLLRQYDVAFWLVVSSGVVALLFLSTGFYLVFTQHSTDFTMKAIGLVFSAGDSALFAYFVKVWQVAGKNLNSAP
jgi:hypothetical protein